MLEVGVGTGLSLPTYGRHLEIVGIDLSPEMLEKARERVAAEGLDNVAELHEMDASDLKFPDASFDTVVAMYVMTVVPDPEKVMRELSRVCRPGGEVIIVNHFSAEEGMRGWVERRMAPFADMLGWRPVFDVERVLVCPDLTLMEKRGLRPWGLFTMMRFRKAKEVSGRRLTRRPGGRAGDRPGPVLAACLDSARRGSLYPPRRWSHRARADGGVAQLVRAAES